MKITKVVLRNKEKEDSRMKAIATVTLDEAFVITGIRLIQGDDKMFEDAIFGAYEEMKKTGEELVKIEL